MTSQSILVTGGAGYIGSHAVLALMDAGFRVSVIDNLVTGFRWAVPNGVAFFEANIGDPEAVGHIIKEQQIEAIMHFAGSVVVPESVADPLKYYRNNTANTRTLIETAIAHRVPRLLFSSTAAIYGVPQQEMVQENMSTAPINPYGMSKLMSEYMLRDCAAAHDFQYGALRYFNVAGADPEGRSGQSTKDATHLIKVAVEAALGKRDKIAIFGNDFPTADGTGVRDYIHVSDLAQAHVLALQHLIDYPDQSLTLNCGYGKGFSVLDVLDAVERVSGRKITREFAPRRAGDPAALIADNRQMLATLPWQPRYNDLDTIIKSALNWESQLHLRRN